MAVIMIGGSEELTADQYVQVVEAMRPAFERAPGFVVHFAHAGEDGRPRIVEVWQTKEASDRFFVEHVRPNLPPGVHPKRQTLDVLGLVLPAE